MIRMKIATAIFAGLALCAAAHACEKDKAAATAKADVGCSHGATGAKTEQAKYEDQAGGCPFHSQATESQKAALVSGAKVTLVGQVVCASCELKTQAECKSVFRTKEGKVFTIVGNDAFEQLAKQTRHGEKQIEVTATTAIDSDQPIVLLHSYKLLG